MDDHRPKPASTPDGSPDQQNQAASTQPSDALERLRTQVERAVRTIRRLRQENERLQARVEELETHPNLDRDDTFVSFDEDPEILRRKINGFIEAIDRRLAKDRLEE